MYYTRICVVIYDLEILWMNVRQLDFKIFKLYMYIFDSYIVESSVNITCVDRYIVVEL
jgi:hypothetical protein